MTRWFMMAGLLGATSMVANEAYAQDNTGAKKKQAAKNKKGKKGKDKPDGVGPFKKDEYPLAERLRPLVLPRNMGEIGLDAPISIISVLGESSTGFALAPSFNYGFGVVEAGVSTGFPLAPDADWNRTLVPRVSWLAWDSKEFDFAPGLSIPLAFVDETSIGVLIDLNSRYVLSDGWYVYFGQGAIPLGVSPDVSLSIVANGGVGWQVNKATALTLDVTPLQILLAPDADATGIWDFLALNVGAQYTPTREWDIGARLSVNTVWGAEFSVITISPYARFRF